MGTTRKTHRWQTTTTNEPHHAIAIQTAINFGVAFQSKGGRTRHSDAGIVSQKWGAGWNWLKNDLLVRSGSFESQSSVKVCVYVCLNA